MDTASTKRTRRRWRHPFGLRTLFAAMTLAAVGCWIETSLTWIRQRHDFLNAYRQSRFVPPHAILANKEVANDSLKAPRLLWLFGEPPTQYIGVPSDDQDVMEKAKRLFPEAEIIPSAVLGATPGRR